MTPKICVAHCGLQNPLLPSHLPFLILETDTYFKVNKVHFIGNKPNKYKLRINFSKKMKLLIAQGS